jgi:hypothetical protein
MHSPGVGCIRAGGIRRHGICGFGTSVPMNVLFQCYLRVEPATLRVWRPATSLFPWYLARRTRIGVNVYSDGFWLSVRISSPALITSSHDPIGAWRCCISRSIGRERGLWRHRWGHHSPTTSVADCRARRAVANARAHRTGIAIPAIPTGLVPVIWVLLLMTSFFFLSMKVSKRNRE